MKKTIIKITATTVCMFISFAVFAQSGMKPKIDESVKSTSGPQIVPPAIVLTVKEQPKPIVPGGEFKPMDTNKSLPTPTNIKTEASDKDQPVMPVLKKAGPPPVVTEMNADPATQERAKPAPVQVIVLKQQ